jgi:hypothetical protein
MTTAQQVNQALRTQGMTQQHLLNLASEANSPCSGSCAVF